MGEDAMTNKHCLVPQTILSPPTNNPGTGYLLLTLVTASYLYTCTQLKLQNITINCGGMSATTLAYKFNVLSNLFNSRLRYMQGRLNHIEGFPSLPHSPTDPKLTVQYTMCI